MKYTVSLAYTDAERREAFGLLKKVYLDEFELDLDLFKSLFSLTFETDVFVVRDETRQIIGTASVMFPQGRLFPTEHIFGATIRQEAPSLPLRQSVEVGRLAKIKNVPNGLISRAIMLAVPVYLRQKNLAGWVATVRPALYRILKKTGLETISFENYIESTDKNQREAVRKYKGDQIISFWASSEDTCRAFEALQTGGIVVDLKQMSISPAVL